MKRFNSAYLEAVAGLVSTSPFFTLVSMEIKALDPGRSRVEMVVEEKHFNPFRMVHGGVYPSLVDAAAFWAVYAQIEEDVGLTTVELKLNYLAPASKGHLIATGRTIKMGKSLCLGEATIEDEQGKLLAYGTETMMIIKDLKIPGIQLPPKFLEQEQEVITGT